MTDEVWTEIEGELKDMIQEVGENPIQTREEFLLLLKDWKVDMALHLDSIIEVLKDHPNKKLMKFFIKSRVKLLRWTNSLLRTDVRCSKQFRLLKKIFVSMLFLTFILKKLGKEGV